MDHSSDLQCIAPLGAPGNHGSDQKNPMPNLPECFSNGNIWIVYPDNPDAGYRHFGSLSSLVQQLSSLIQNDIAPRFIESSVRDSGIYTKSAHCAGCCRNKNACEDLVIEHHPFTVTRRKPVIYHVPLFVFWCQGERLAAFTTWKSGVYCFCNGHSCDNLVRGFSLVDPTKRHHEPSHALRTKEPGSEEEVARTILRATSMPVNVALKAAVADSSLNFIAAHTISAPMKRKAEDSPQIRKHYAERQRQGFENRIDNELPFVYGNNVDRAMEILRKDKAYLNATAEEQEKMVDYKTQTCFTIQTRDSVRKQSNGDPDIHGEEATVAPGLTNLSVHGTTPALAVAPIVGMPSGSTRKLVLDLRGNRPAGLESGIDESSQQLSSSQQEHQQSDTSNTPTPALPTAHDANIRAIKQEDTTMEDDDYCVEIPDPRLAKPSAKEECARILAEVFTQWPTAARIAAVRHIVYKEMGEAVTRNDYAALYRLHGYLIAELITAPK